MNKRSQALLDKVAEWALHSDPAELGNALSRYLQSDLWDYYRRSDLTGIRRFLTDLYELTTDELTTGESVAEEPTAPAPDGRVIPVFVYGTLKQGYHNNRLLDRATYLGPAVTALCIYRLRSVGFPILTMDGNARVQGELYLVDAATLARLDQLEGEGRMYKRQRIWVRQNGERSTLSEAYTYVGMEAYWDQVPFGEVPVQDGVYNWSRNPAGS